MRIGLRAEICTLLLERTREEVFQAPWARQSLSQLHKLFRFIRKAAVGSASTEGIYPDGPPVRLDPQVMVSWPLL